MVAGRTPRARAICLGVVPPPAAVAALCGAHHRRAWSPAGPITSGGSARRDMHEGEHGRRRWNSVSSGQPRQPWRSSRMSARLMCWVWAGGPRRTWMSGARAESSAWNGWCGVAGSVALGAVAAAEVVNRGWSDRLDQLAEGRRNS